MKEGEIGTLWRFGLKGPLLVPGHRSGRGFLRSLYCGVRLIPECREVFYEECVNPSDETDYEMLLDAGITTASIPLVTYTKGDVILGKMGNWEDIYGGHLYDLSFGYVGVSIYDTIVEDYQPWFLGLFRKVIEASPIICEWVEWEDTWVFGE
ncbi:MAG: hypothetical protein COZ49_00535 [Candidatus Yonathbacteria bacterium CG_4_10_14_3_um_filter_47_65]|uniref:Uncharacterized protein n=2 Tax=Parcubacteria group TaxID=1794811 RepID=A0A2M8D7Z2_9BACT|nr:MAG: hypothetical protein AUJ44_01545 [Candidatus Nomurabacteria bacterium CG1_02_47_685]PIP03613.1 MAG: hypothetical protein COX54_03205 [Candidatus Yonathbacteria bacterium CG23_combo_of_CG06-09_8_20_14_all_46_18]PIQ31980.1 MAG: hypothetical protein COW61_02740 [Candidatus Yonathbacteria bacterium CG17_big_fil_post_rev_8_21_14_2_50_46_19]PIX56724.1 MAG: hypothetical protein COZ49_00535 [Candidatus Yonathbacteria bacterium CG_4_10_14_3_um_filter_47_65]PIY57539.1 MAG: hypothetical protein CO